MTTEGFCIARASAASRRLFAGRACFSKSLRDAQSFAALARFHSASDCLLGVPLWSLRARLSCAAAKAKAWSFLVPLQAASLISFWAVDLRSAAFNGHATSVLTLVVFASVLSVGAFSTKPCARPPLNTASRAS